MTDRNSARLLAIAITALVAAGGVALASQQEQPPRAPVVVEHPYRAQHEAMMQRMRAGVTPAMVEQMRIDPMWRMMREDRYVRLMEQDQAQIDRMLGRNPAGRGGG